MLVHAGFSTNWPAEQATGGTTLVQKINVK